MDSEDKTCKNQDLQKTYSDLIKDYNKAKERFICCQKQIKLIKHILTSKGQSSVKEINCSELETMVTNSVGKYALQNSNNLTLQLYSSESMSLLKCLACVRLPKLSMISLRYVPKDSDDMRDFLLNSIPNDLKNFYFNTIYYSKIECSNYFYHLQSAISKVTQNIRISFTKLSCAEFSSITKAAKYCVSLCFCCCTILTDSECDFGLMQDSKIKIIDLSGCGGGRYSNWNQNPHRFVNIISAIHRCDILSSSVQTIIANVDSLLFDSKEVIMNELQSKFDKTTIDKIVSYSD